ncbi:MAG: Ppx/GppA family phosphatase [Alphaproteobacteria bacterium]
MSALSETVSDLEIWEVPARVAVIDVGSNTVRLVAFDMDGRIPKLIFNEKAFCGLGRSLATTGRLDEDGITLALKTIHRFVTIAGQMNVAHLEIVATAAVRESANGGEFSDDVETVTGQSLHVISGEEEAYFSAMGVAAGIQDATGVAGDMGGGSLELVGLEDGQVAPGLSLPLGSLRLVDAHGDDQSAIRKTVDKALAGIDWLKAYRGQNLYAVGGTWRAIARLHMAARDYPLRILHHYEISRDEAAGFVSKIDEYLDDDLISASGVSRKRVAMLPVSALVLSRLIDALKPDRLVISGLGLREGILFHHAAEELRRADPLLVFCREVAVHRSRFPEHGDYFMGWTEALFDGESVREKRLRYAVCLLSDIAWSGHPDYRAELAMDQIMLAQVLGTDHPGRAFIGLALFVLNGGGVGAVPAERARPLLSDDEAMRAVRLGLALRLGQRISGGTRELLELCSLTATKEELVLQIIAGGGYMVGEAVERRLNGLANALDLKPVIEEAAAD